MVNCFLCKMKINVRKDRYVHIQDYNKGKKESDKWCHLSCFNKGMKPRELNDMEKRANNLLSMAEGIFGKLGAKEVYEIK